MDITDRSRPAHPRAVAAVAVAIVSFLVPLFGTIVAVGVVWWAANSASFDDRDRRLIRIAATLTAAVAVLHLIAFVLLMPGDVVSTSTTQYRPVP